MQYKLLTQVSINKFSIQNCPQGVANRNFILGNRQVGKAQDFDSCITLVRVQLSQPWVTAQIILVPPKNQNIVVLDMDLLFKLPLTITRSRGLSWYVACGKKTT